ncbi:MAG: TetR/AcrR family transcriptional regulator [Magnetospirillum sp.]|nr:TetR/AcrR family transcriptional regulator [Magnetospirillum sp.]
MRYAKGQKDATRQRIVETAARRFRGEGIAAVGVASLMADAGLTHGGFYAHFPSKEDLVRDAAAESLECTLALLASEAEAGGIDALITAYLSPGHRDHPEAGCAIACLAAELTRHPAPTRKAFAGKVNGLTALIARHLPSGHGPAAAALLGLMVGTLQLARLAPDAEQADLILKAGRDAARRLAAPIPPCNRRPEPRP